MILRNFLFLDTATMTDYLSTLEGGIVEGVDETEAEKTGRPGKAGVKLLEGGMTSETSRETRQRLAIPDAAKFQRLYELLEGQDLIQQLDAFDEGIWNQLRRGELLELQATTRLPEFFMMSQMVEDVAPLLDLMAAFGEDPISDPEQRKALEGMRTIAGLMDQNPVPLLFEAASTPGFRFVANLPRQHLRCELSDLQGEMIVFGKILRILPKGKKLEVFSLFPALSKFLPRLNKEQRHKAQQEMPKELAEVIYGPASVLAPVAVYR